MIMKKRCLIFAILLCVVFITGCQTAANDRLVNGSGETQPSSQESNIEFSETALENSPEDITEPSIQADDGPASVLGTFQSVLLNELWVSDPPLCRRTGKGECSWL